MIKFSFHNYSLLLWGSWRGLSLFMFLFASCDSGDIEEQSYTITDKGHTVKLTAVLSGIDTWESKYSISLAGFSTGDNYAQVVRSLPNTTPDGTRVEMILSNIGDDINTVELAITNRLRERIITLARVNLEDYANQKDTIRMDLGPTDVSRFGALQLGDGCEQVWRLAVGAFQYGMHTVSRRKRRGRSCQPESDGRPFLC